MRRLIFGLCLLSACSWIKTPVPSVLTPPPPGLQLNDSITDYDVALYAEGILQLWGWRSIGLQASDISGAIAMAGVSTASVSANAGRASPAVITALVAAGSFLAQTFAAVNPQARANALATGAALIRNAKAKYLVDLTANGLQRISHKVITPWGAALYASVEGAVGWTDSLMVGLMPPVANFNLVTSPANPQLPQPPAMTPDRAREMAAKVNAEKPDQAPESSLP